MNKKVIVIFLLFLGTLTGAWIWLLLGAQDGQLPTSAVLPANFAEEYPVLNQSQDRSIASNSRFEIQYLPEFDSFLISVLAAPFESTRITAEKVFLQQLALSQEQACKLQVVVATPYFANPAEAGTDYPLSFCK